MIQNTGDAAKTFLIKSDGHFPEIGDAYIYEDQDYRFWFYPAFKSVTTGGHVIVIHRASNQRFMGPPPHIKSPDVSRLMSNIRSHFVTKDLFQGDITRPEDRPNDILFTWTLAQ